MRKFNAIKNAVNFGKGKSSMSKFDENIQVEETTEFKDSEELREKTKHRTFTSMAQRRRWLALNEQIEQNKKRNGKEEKQ